MDKTINESIEKQQLVASGEEDEEGRAGLSPAASGVLSSSGAASYGSKSHTVRHIVPNASGSTR